MSWLVVVSTFIAAGVEWVEAFTIVLAVGMFRSWRSALLGTGLAAVVLLAIVGVFGATVNSFPLGVAQVVVGVFLLLFGLKWLHKAILRSSGFVALHDEAEEFEATRAALSGREHWIGVTTAFNGVVLEGLEVVFIVIALGGLNSRLAATVGALAALGAVIVAGVLLRAPLTRVPENALKYTVGVMLTSFGTFFAGEGIGVHWWRDNVSLLPLIATYGLASLVLVRVLRAPPRLDARPLRVPRAILAEIWGLFVGDGPLALAAVAAVLGAAIFADRVGHHRALAALLLVAGVLAAVALGLADSVRGRAPEPEPEQLAEEPAPPPLVHT